MKDNAIFTNSEQLEHTDILSDQILQGIISCQYASYDDINTRTANAIDRVN